jgi:hypothetical protein
MVQGPVGTRRARSAHLRLAGTLDLRPRDAQEVAAARFRMSAGVIGSGMAAYNVKRCAGRSRTRVTGLWAEFAAIAGAGTFCGLRRVTR